MTIEAPSKFDLTFDPEHEFLRDVFPWEVTKEKGGRAESVEGWLYASEVVAYLLWGKTCRASERDEDEVFPSGLLWWLGETGQLRDWSGPLWSISIEDESLIQKNGFGWLTQADFVPGRFGIENVLLREANRRPPDMDRFITEQVLPGIARLEALNKKKR